MEIVGRAIRKTPATGTEGTMAASYAGMGGEDLTSAGGGAATFGLAASTSASTQVIKALAGRIMAVLCVSAGTATTPVQFFDNTATASGTVIGAVPGSATVTGASFLFAMPAANGIVVQQVANGPGLTVSYY
jgi:hypothetical protein